MAGNLDYRIERRPLSTLSFLETNARYMEKKDFDRLVENIKTDGCLSSLPVIYDGDTYGEILSGNHRVKAAIQAGIEEADCLVITSPLSKQKKIAIALSHNSITGKDDPNILLKMFSELDDIEMKEYSGLTDDDFKIDEIELVPLSFDQIEMQNLLLLFLKTDYDIFVKNKEKIEKFAEKNKTWVAALEDFDRFHEAVFSVKEKYNIINTGLAVKTMCDLALKYIALQEQEEPADAE